MKNEHNKKGMGSVVWLTGLSGAGKSTLANRSATMMRAEGIFTVVIDGDKLRAGLSSGLGFSEEDRRENIRRAREVALLVAEHGVVAIAALISPYRRDRGEVAACCSERGIRFLEVFVNAPLCECERRDPKLLYRKARAGEVPLFTGLSSPYEPPENPAIELKTAEENIETCAKELFRMVMSYGQGY